MDMVCDQIMVKVLSGCRKLWVIIISLNHFKGNGKGPSSLIGMAAVESDARWMIIPGLVHK
jgi:hypothetical protein